MVQADGATVVINAGADRGVVIGHEFNVYENAQPITDPETGDVIGHASIARIGRIKVSDVRDRFSLAFITAGQPGDLRAGQLLRRTSAPAAGKSTRPNGQGSL
jgi:hypothetical protein